jgi:hypothetical protein
MYQLCLNITKPLFHRTICCNILVTLTNTNRYTKLHPNTNSGCGRFNYYRIIYHYDDSAYYFGNLKPLKPFKQAF